MIGGIANLLLQVDPVVQIWICDARLAWKGRETDGQGCVEANPWQQGWFVPHDVEGLVRLMGVRHAFTEELEKFFGVVPDDFRWNPAYNHPNA